MLTRVKNFVATGLATAGRLYAGDLNAIQDAAAAQADFAQTIDVSTIRIGDSTLAVLKYGTGEIRVTSMARFDGIVRALGGLYAGQFTTTQRDALATGAGLTPYGLVIYNTTTDRLEVNKGNDTTRNWKPLGSLIVSLGGSQVGIRPAINFIAGTNVSLTVADDSGNDRVNVTINAASQGTAGYVPIGGSIIWNGASDPTNFLIEDGRSLLRSGGSPDYSALFAAIGTTYGSVDGTHFNIPDSRGRVLVGANAKHALGGTEGLSVGQRSTSHHHGADQAQDPHGGYTASGTAPASVLIDSNTSGDTANLNTPAWRGCNFAIRYA